MINGKLAIGIDLGATKLAIGLVNQEGVVLKSKIEMTDPTKVYKTIVAQIIALIKEITQGIDAPIVGIGLGVPGQVDKNGLINFAPNLEWHEVALKEDLSKEFTYPIFITNDVRAAAWGEWIYGAGKGYKDLICMFIGTGIGGGIISEGKMLNGCSNTCGEIGHMVIDIHGPSCTCGGRGCLESIIGGWAIAKRAQEAIKSYGEAGRGLLQLVDGDIEKITAKTVVQAAEIKDPLAELLLENIKQCLIAGCVSLVNAFNPCCIILGGGIIDGARNIFPSVEWGVKQRALKAATVTLTIVPAALRQNSGIVGAAALVFNQFEQRGY